MPRDDVAVTASDARADRNHDSRPTQWPATNHDRAGHESACEDCRAKTTRSPQRLHECDLGMDRELMRSSEIQPEPRPDHRSRYGGRRLGVWGPCRSRAGVRGGLQAEVDPLTHPRRRRDPDGHPLRGLRRARARPV